MTKESTKESTINKFWRFMDSARGYFFLMLSTIFGGVLYMVGARKLINWIMERRNHDNSG